MRHYRIRLMFMAVAVGILLSLAGGNARAQTGGFDPSLAENEAQAAIAAAVVAACGGIAGGTDLDGECAAMNALAAADQPTAMQGLVHDTAAAQGAAVVETGKAASAVLAGRMRVTRQLSRDGKPAGLAFNGKQVKLDDRQLATLSFRGTGGGASSHGSPLGGRLGVFVNFDYGAGDQDASTSGSEAAFDFDVFGATLGADYRITDKFIAGLAVQYKLTDADYSGSANGSTLDVNSYGVSVYATFFPTDALNIDASASYGFNDFNSKRRIVFSGVDRTAKGDTDGDQLSLSAGAGYQLTAKALTYGPYVQVNYTNADVDGYTETGAGGFNLAMSDQEVESLSSILGIRADYNFSTSWGVISPSVRFEWEHEFDNDSRVVAAQFASDPGSFANLSTDKPDEDFFNAGAGIVATLSNGISTFADFEALLGHSDLTNYTLTVGARFEL